MTQSRQHHNLDYADLWDSFRQTERRALLANVTNQSIDGQEVKPWDHLPLGLKKELLKLDWEFNIGRKL